MRRASRRPAARGRPSGARAERERFRRWILLWACWLRQALQFAFEWLEKNPRAVRVNWCRSATSPGRGTPRVAYPTAFKLIAGTMLHCKQEAVEAQSGMARAARVLGGAFRDTRESRSKGRCGVVRPSRAEFGAAYRSIATPPACAVEMGLPAQHLDFRLIFSTM